MSSWHAKGGAAPIKNGPNTTLPLPPQLNLKKNLQLPPYQTKMFRLPPFTIILQCSRSTFVGGGERGACHGAP